MQSHLFSVVDPHWFQCVSGSDWFQCEAGSGSLSHPTITKRWYFYMKNIHFYEGTKAFLKGRKSGLFGNFGRFPCSWIQIRIRIRIGSGSRSAKSMRIWIHNTVHLSTRPKSRTRIFFVITRLDFALAPVGFRGILVFSVYQPLVNSHSKFFVGCGKAFYSK